MKLSLTYWPSPRDACASKNAVVTGNLVNLRNFDSFLFGEWDVDAVKRSPCI